MSDIDLIMENVKRKLAKIVSDSADMLILLAEQRAPGGIKNEFYKLSKDDGLTVIVGNKHPAAHFVEYGTGPRGNQFFHSFAGEPRPKFTLPFISAVPPGKMIRFPKPTKTKAPREPPIPGNTAFEKDGYVFTEKTRGQLPHPFLRNSLVDTRPVMIAKIREEFV